MTRWGRPGAMRGEGARRFRALVRKETYQVLRDPSSLLIAVVLPLILLFLFGYGLSLDVSTVRIGVVLEDAGLVARDLAASFQASRSFDVRLGGDRREFVDDIVAGRLKGMVVIPADFGRRRANHVGGAIMQVIAGRRLGAQYGELRPELCARRRRDLAAAARGGG